MDAGDTIMVPRATAQGAVDERPPAIRQYPIRYDWLRPEPARPAPLWTRREFWSVAALCLVIGIIIGSFVR